jgi:hypothetical protein
MDVIKEHIIFLKEHSYFCLSQLQGGQDCFKRFIYCCIEKIYTCTLSIEQLYDLMGKKEDFEFSIGLVLRSLLMDCILVQYLRFISIQVGDKGEEIVKVEMDKIALMYIADGAAFLINDFYDDDALTEAQKKQMGDKLASIFPGVFDIDKNGRQKIKNAYKLKIKDIYKKSKHPELPTRRTIYNLYSYYSKYDHVSHFSSALGRIPFEERKKRIDSSVAMILQNFRDLLFLSFFDKTISTYFLPTITNIDNHIKESYPEFQVSNEK